MTTTVPPAALTSWMVAVPMPLPPPCTSTAPPSGSAPSWKTFRKTVRKTSGSAAASVSVSASGTGIAEPAGTTTSSA